MVLWVIMLFSNMVR